MSKFYTCKYDRPFKEIMLNENNKTILKALLEHILKVTIYEITILNQEKNVGNIHIKRKHLDAIVETNIGRIGIEVNSENKDYVHPKSMAYICHEYASYTLTGEEYNEDMMIIQINLSYGLGKDKKERVYKIQDETGKLFVKNFEIYEVNMDYYKELWDNKDKKGIENDNLLIMLDLEQEELKKLSQNNQMVKKYMEELIKLNGNPRFQEYMSAEEDARKIRNSELSEARKEGAVEIAKNLLKNGISIDTIINSTGISKEELIKLNINPRYQEYMSAEEDARKIRNSELSEAKKEGLAEGRNERNIEIAKNLLKMNLTIEQVIEATGLTKEEIENLK